MINTNLVFGRIEIDFRALRALNLVFFIDIIYGF